MSFFALPKDSLAIPENNNSLLPLNPQNGGGAGGDDHMDTGGAEGTGTGVVNPQSAVQVAYQVRSFSDTTVLTFFPANLSIDCRCRNLIIGAASPTMN